MLQRRPANERGLADHGWLKSRFSFSFAEYYDPRHIHFGALRVINDDVVAASKGFGMHPHRDMEIITYMLNGELGHRDSMGNGSVIRVGEVQKMSAGTGVMHSEMNPSRTEAAELLQIWIFPSHKNLKPSYEQVFVPEEKKRGRFHQIAGGSGDEYSVSLHQDALLYAGLFDGNETTDMTLSNTRRYYLHVARGSITVNGEVLNQGDALLITEEIALHISNGHAANVLLFDLA